MENLVKGTHTYNTEHLSKLSSRPGKTGKVFLNLLKFKQHGSHTDTSPRETGTERLEQPST